MSHSLGAQIAFMLSQSY